MNLIWTRRGSSKHKEELIIEQNVQARKEIRAKIERIVRDARDDEIRSIVRNPGLPEHHFAYLLSKLIEYRAILEGHFKVIRSKAHSRFFLQFARLAGYPDCLARISKMLAHLFWDTPIDTVLHSEYPYDLYAWRMARELGYKTARLMPFPAPPTPLSMNFSLYLNEKVLIVNANAATGGDILSLKSFLDGRGAKLAGVGLFACCYPGGLAGLREFLLEQGNIPEENVQALVEIEIDYAPDQENCPLCLDGKEYIEEEFLI